MFNLVRSIKHEHNGGNRLPDQDVFSLPFENISTAVVTETYLQGEIIYGDGVVFRDVGLDFATTVAPEGVDMDFPATVAVGLEGESSGATKMVPIVSACIFAATAFL